MEFIYFFQNKKFLSCKDYQMNDLFIFKKLIELVSSFDEIINIFFCINSIEMQLFIKTSSGKTLTIDLEESSTLYTFVYKIQ